MPRQERPVVESGFYRAVNGRLQFGRDILSADYRLRAGLKDTYALPIDGWQWFDTLAGAKAAFGITE